jgi:putative tryptophan/tyrosine transport system substrate-binding protein
MQVAVAGRIALGALMASATALLPAASYGQPATQSPANVAKVGILAPGIAPPPGMPSQVLQVFRKALAEQGYVEGRNLQIDERWQPPGKPDWLPPAIDDMARAKVEAIFAFGAIPARAIKTTKTAIPTVFIMVIPTGEFVANPQRPEATMTGFTTFDPKLPRQQLEILKQALPAMKRIAYIGDEAVGEAPFKPHEAAARALGLDVTIHKIRPPKPDYPALFATIKQDKAEALVLLEHPLTSVHRKIIAEQAMKNGLPTLAPRLAADVGVLLAYGTPLSEAAKPAASHIARILKGASPAELPVEAVHRHELIVNANTAKQLRVSLPQEVLSKAAQVVSQ